MVRGSPGAPGRREERAPPAPPPRPRPCRAAGPDRGLSRLKSRRVLIAFNKPYGVLCKFSAEPDRATLADFIRVPGVYPAGRLDADSEGLLLLTDDGALQARISSPRFKLAKTYWAQVEGTPTEGAVERLRLGVNLGDFTSRAAGVRQIDEP